MKILVMYQYFGTPKGSWSTRMYELTRRWVKEGHEVTVVTAPYAKSDITATRFIERQKVEGINLIVINSPDSNKDPIFKRVFNSFKFSFVASYFALKEKADVVLASSGPITIGIPAIIARKFSRKKMIFEVRDLWPAGGIEMNIIKKNWQKKAALLFEKMCYNNASLVVAASTGQRDHIIGRFKNLNTLVIPNASDIDLFGKEQYLKEVPERFKNSKIFTHIGSLGFIHNCMLIVKTAEVLNKMKRSDIQIVFIGDGAEKEQLLAYVKENNLENIHFLGLKPKQELPAWVQLSRATLFTTLNNPIQNTSSPNKVFDSFAAGVPVIQTTEGWIKDLVQSHNCGINVIPDNPEAFANAIISLADDKGLAEKLGANAKGLALTEFNRDVLAERYLTAIAKVVGA
jgi:glycosyltransferase involved in cell wall biosynthesis